jgi:hypothetical protein
MDLSGGPNCGVMSKPVIKKDMEEMLKVCKQFKKSDVKKLMGVSDAIAEKDVERYKNWDKNQFKAACLAMDGPAFRGFDGNSLGTGDRKLAQSRVRILSGLYGVLKPYDAIRPYRLEMGSKVQSSRGGNLYQFWGDIIAKELVKDAKVVINTASQEYFKAVSAKVLKDAGVPIITVDFPGPTVYAKKARGLICRFAVTAHCKKPEDLKKFVGGPEDTYVFDAAKSTAAKYVFKRTGDGNKAAKAKATGKRKADASAEAGPKKKAK